ncbi:hypothetical protein CVT24_013272 [Panaeolus cyanescens]|uniref:Uncharacterized protein n=1 Tax=Panaeolus cyanescens TaxID=181874 RepID=A0A409VW22_9AGAR|nr:hypothetical protein CVT24_013272 [Panaeolus cyanescens]
MNTDPTFIERYIKALAPEILTEYIEKTFPPEMVSLGCYTPENAPLWVDFPELMIFAAHRIQRGTSTASQPSSTSGRPALSLMTPTRKPGPLTYNASAMPSPTTSQSTPRSNRLQPSPRSPSPSRPSQTTSESECIELSDSDEAPRPPRAPKGPLHPKTPSTGSETLEKNLAVAVSSTPKLKRKLDALGDNSDSEVEIVASKPARQIAGRYTTKPVSKKLKKSKKSKQSPEPDSATDTDSVEIVAADIRITRQMKTPKLVTLTNIPSTWAIIDGAYLLDLRNDTRKWIDPSGDPLSMAAIIKSQDQDAWGGGSAGHTQPSKCPKVLILDGKRCQVSEHSCQGVYHCSELDMTLLDTCRRYEPDDDEMRELFEADRVVNDKEGSSIELNTAAFYKEAMKEPCKALLDSGNQCDGLPVYRKFKNPSNYGRLGFIGCTAFYKGPGDKTKHRFVTIPNGVKEELLIELFESKDGSFAQKNLSTTACARVVHPRNGGKGYRECPYTHVKEGKVIQGSLVHRKCPATIKIFSPLDRNDRRAVVIISECHNHPRFPSTKLSRDGKDMYEAAIHANGASRTTVARCDNANTTRKIFDGNAMMAVDPALGIARNKRRLVQKARTADHPHGTGFEGVLYTKRQDDEKKTKEQQYIHSISTHDGVHIIITMVPYLASRIHDAYATQHDNTYKRCYGEWKEWEVVIWDRRLNMRVTVARIYCNRETRKAFEKMWTGFWSTVEQVTGKPVKMKFIDGSGLRAIVVDGCKPQVDACGDALLKLISTERKHSLIQETNPQIIVQYILRTCTIHLERKLDNLAKTVSKDVMDRIRGFPFLKTKAEVDEFVLFCQNSEYKCVRDWINDKKGSEWFIPSVNQYMSKISEEDWYLTPGDTNLNESAHPFTNIHTGTNLSLLEAINLARVLDNDVSEKMKLAEINCILPNPANTKAERDHNNRKRLEMRTRAAAARQVAASEIHGIDEQLSTIKDQARELQQKKKELLQAEGMSKSPSKPSARGKMAISLEDILSNDVSEPTSPMEPTIPAHEHLSPVNGTFDSRELLVDLDSFSVVAPEQNSATEPADTSATERTSVSQPDMSIDDLATMYGGRVPSLQELLMHFSSTL